MEQDKHSFFTKQFDSWQDFEREFENWCITYYEPVNIKRSSMKYNEKLMEELFNRFRYQHVMYACHHSGPIRRRIKDGSRPNQESARLDCQFYFKIKHDTEVNKIIFMNNKNLTHNHPLDEKIYKNYSFVRNKKLDSIRDIHDKTTWLTDFHIYLFFELLHKQLPNVNGLCSPARIHLYNGSLENSIFIFNANANHWLTISNLNCNNVWNVYDSLSYQNELLINFFQVILPNEEKVSVSFENVQQQVGGNDCGLFALAFATSLCYKDVPSLIFYDQISLRNHYVKCIEDNEIQRFPSKPKRGSTRNASKLIDLYLN
jgi:hypothetical protein